MVENNEEIVGDIEGDKFGQARNSIIGFEGDARGLTVNYVTVKTERGEFFFKPNEIWGLSEDGKMRTWIKVPEPFHRFLAEVDKIELILTCIQQ